ncbi:MAG: hypothetical protein LBC42_02140 [Puniceicoccales bacterium]|jgi:hypothetical protein|nr:hypothetical protein [Puniceicoccales bacterium]
MVTLDDMILREDAFLRDAEKLHLTFDETVVYSQIEDADVRKRLREFVDYEGTFAEVLDEICSNVVGRTLFRLVATKAAMKRGGQRIGLYDGAQNSNLYSRKDFAVLINLRMFDDRGIGIDARQYYCIDEDGQIVPKRKTLVGTLFHEFCHALHDIEQISEITEAGELHNSNYILGCTWDNAEELRTISGCIFGVAYDPICDHCFDLCYSLGRGEPFRPRYSHRGFHDQTPPHEEAMERRKLAAHLSESRKIMDGWKKYVL